MSALVLFRLPLVQKETHFIVFCCSSFKISWNSSIASSSSCSIMSSSISSSFTSNSRSLGVILTDSRSSIPHLSNWLSIGDSTSRSILHLFQQLCDLHPIHLQWVPSYVGLPGNEIADDLAKAATSDPVDLEDHMVLTSTEI
ncbi:RNase H domain-containing protein [Trichonephila clavipes]|nr:RNase H domain-containing protein [Trichonephila clavipes]